MKVFAISTGFLWMDLSYIANTCLQLQRDAPYSISSASIIRRPKRVIILLEILWRGPNSKIRELTRENALYLSTAASFNHPLLSKVYEWFSEKITGIHGTLGSSLDLKVRLNEKNHSKIQQLLKFADLGVSDYHLVEPKEEDPETNGDLIIPSVPNVDSCVSSYKKCSKNGCFGSQKC